MIIIIIIISAPSLSVNVDKIIIRLFDYLVYGVVGTTVAVGSWRILIISPSALDFGCSC